MYSSNHGSSLLRSFSASASLPPTNSAYASLRRMSKTVVARGAVIAAVSNSDKFAGKRDASSFRPIISNSFSLGRVKATKFVLIVSSAISLRISFPSEI